MHELGRRGKNGLELLRLLYRRPVVTVADVVAVLKMSAPSANALVSEFERLGLLKEPVFVNIVVRFFKQLSAFFPSLVSLAPARG